MDTRYILSFNVIEQLLIVIQNSCEVNSEHARVCSGVLWMWHDHVVIQFDTGLFIHKQCIL